MAARTAVTAAEAGVKVGDFFVSSWGYEQTNVDFYKVVGISPSGKTLKVQQWSSRHVSGDGWTGTVVPGDGPATTAVWVTKPSAENNYCGTSRQVPVAVLTKRLAAWSDRPTFVVNSYANAYLWSGQPKGYTAYA